MTDVAALEQRARELIHAGKFEEAEALIRPHLASGTGPIVLWRMLAAAIRPQGRIAETRVIQEMIVETVPGHLPGRFDLSETALLMGDFERDYAFCADAHPTAFVPEAQRATFQGYRRANGRVGTRNEIWILCTVGCVARTAQKIA